MFQVLMFPFKLVWVLVKIPFKIIFFPITMFRTSESDREKRRYYAKMAGDKNWRDY